MDDFNGMNEAIIKRNMSMRAASQRRGGSRGEYERRAARWENQAAKHAQTLGTRLVPLPGAVEDIITAELFLRLAGEETA